MEEKKNQFYQTQKQKFYIKKVHKSVNFSLDNFKKLVPQLHLNYSNEKKNKKIDKLDREDIINNQNVVSMANNSNKSSNIINISLKDNFINKENILSPTRTHSNYVIKSSIRKKSLQTQNSLFNAFTKNLKENNNNDETTQNRKLSQNTQKLSISIKNNNPNSLKRIQTGKSSNALTLNNNNNNFFPNNKLFNKIQFRNSKNFAYESNKLIKSEGEEKSGTTILTDRNKNKEHIKFSSLSRRNSINKLSQVNKISYVNKSFKRTKTLLDPKYRKPNIFSKKSKHHSKRIDPCLVNPLLISEEDKIFDEMKKYLCFKYEQKLLDNKSVETKKNNEKSKANVFKLKKNKNKILTPEQIKLDYLYLTTTKINKKIRYIKRKKDRQELAEYQNNLLDIIKPSISDYTYNHLKDRLMQIRIKNNKKYQNNYKRLKEIENEEEDVINEFNSTCEKCLKTFKRIREQKEVVHSINLKIKLPLLNFISCLKKKKRKKSK